MWLIGVINLLTKSPWLSKFKLGPRTYVPRAALHMARAILYTYVSCVCIRVVAPIRFVYICIYVYTYIYIYIYTRI